jgi:DNA replication protein DnaC
MIIKKLSKPIMKPVLMTCDSAIDKKLEDHEAVKVCFSRYSFTIIAGKMGSGKTSTTLSLLRDVFSQCFHNIFIIIPENSLHSIPEKDNHFLPKENECKYIYHEYNAETLQEILDQLQDESADGYSSLLVIDDMGSKFKQDKTAENLLNNIIIRMRHLKTSIILLTQNIYQNPKKWREVCTNLICFDLGKSQMEKIFNEFFDYKKDQFDEIMKLYKNPWDYLLLNLKHKRLFFDYNEILFDDKK